MKSWVSKIFASKYLGGLWVSIKKAAFPNDLSLDSGIMPWRESVWFSLTIIGLVLGLVAWPATINRCVRESQWAQLSLAALGYLAVLVVFILRREIKYEYRAAVLLLFIYTIGVGTLVNLGLNSTGTLWLFVFAVLAGIVLGIKGAVIALAVNLATLVLMGLLIKSGLLPWAANLPDPMSKWLAISFNLIALNTMLTLTVALILKGLESTYYKERSAAASLEQDRASLAASKKELEIEVAERRKAEEALRLSEERYRGLYNNITDFLYTHDLEGRIVDINPSAAAHLGYSIEEIIGKSISEFMKEKYRPNFHDQYLTGIKSTHFFNGTFRLISKDGREVYVEYRNNLVKGREGADYVSGVGRNVTDRIVAQREVRRLEKQLLQAQKMEAVGALAGGIAHDFNNILTIILGYNQMALRKAENPDMIECLNHIKEAGLRARDLVEHILAFSRQTEHKFLPVDIRHLVKESLKLLRASIPSTIEIKQNITARRATILADPTQINQVLMNLSTNAFHAMGEKSGILTFGLAEKEIKAGSPMQQTGLAPGSYVELSVEDTGTGITPQIRDRIFDPYFTTKSLGEGTGLGLATVHGIVKSHSGAVTVDSRPGRGSVFRIYLPLIEEDEKEEREAEAPLEKGRERLLIVDDEKAIVEVSKEMLEGLGYRVETRTSSREAFEAFKKRPADYDLVITDQTMPHMTGLELASEINRIRTDIPIILCTGFSASFAKEKAKAAGIREIILKPILMGKLAQAIRRILDENTD